VPPVPSQGATLPPPGVSSSPAQALAIDAMLLCWALAVGIAVWGSLREARRADIERRRELASERQPGPTPGIEGFLDRWAWWALLLAAAGLAFLGYASQLARG
jgi:hypothetical protein